MELNPRPDIILCLYRWVSYGYIAIFLVYRYIDIAIYIICIYVCVTVPHVSGDRRLFMFNFLVKKWILLYDSGGWVWHGSIESIFLRDISLLSRKWSRHVWMTGSNFVWGVSKFNEIARFSGLVFAIQGWINTYIYMIFGFRIRRYV